VDEAGRPTGKSTVAMAHQAPGQLHRAFSVVLVEPTGQILLQQRAATKTRFPLRWGNSCCGHPAPGQPVTEAAAQRLVEELSVASVSLDELGVYAYHAEDPATGRVEREYDHVLFGRVDPAVPLTPDPGEVAALRWIQPAALRTEMTADPDAFAPWLAGVVALLPDGASGP
jgi:isopentenyl-diphosphate delta-isomerase